MSKIVSFILKMMISKGERVFQELDLVTKNPKEEQIKLLKSIITNSANTKYGLEHNFSNINSVEDYEKNVPVVNYDDLQEYIECMLNGETNCLTKNPIVHFNVTSGTMGVQRRYRLPKIMFLYFLSIMLAI